MRQKTRRWERLYQEASEEKPERSGKISAAGVAQGRRENVPGNKSILKTRIGCYR